MKNFTIKNEYNLVLIYVAKFFPLKL